MDRAVDPAAEQGAIGGIDDRIRGKRGDVGKADVKPRRADRCGDKRRDAGDYGSHFFRHGR